MIEFLQKKILKVDVGSAQGKKGIAMLCSVVGIILNILLFIVKYMIGSISGSVSIVADAFNNITDAGTSAAMLFGVKVASYGKGKDHPMGHGRFEWIISSIMAFLVMIIGWNLLTESAANIGSNQTTKADWVMLVIMVLSVGVKFYMYLYNRKYGRLVDSETMKAVSADSISDAVATAAVIVSVLISQLFGINVDGYCGVLVSLFIIFNGFKSLSETSGRIMGTAPDREELEKLREIVLASGFFIDIYELNVEDYGMGRQRAVIRAGYSTECSCAELQEQIQRVYDRLYSERGLESLIVAERIVDSQLADELRKTITGIIKKIEPFAYASSVRIVGGDTYRSVYCDIAVPQNREGSEPVITEKIEEAVSGENMTVYTSFTIFHDVHGKRQYNKKRAEGYDTLMEKRIFPRYYGGSLDKHHEVLKVMLGEVRNARVLDVGCGSCDSVNYLSTDIIYTGIDASEAFEGTAKEKLDKHGFTHSEFIVGNACAMDAEAGFYDVVLCNLSLNSIYPCESLINEMKRVLRKSGLLIGSVPVNDYGKHRFYSDNDIESSSRLKEFLEMNGFEAEIMEPVNGAICYFKACRK